MSKIHQNSEQPRDQLQKLASANNLRLNSVEFATILDKQDPLANFRQKFNYPKKRDLLNSDKNLIQDENEECLYFCGNSLGLKPTSADRLVQEQLDKWGTMGVEMHFADPLPAVSCDNYGRDTMGKLVGAHPENVSLMNSLTVNLHLLLISFYQPTQKRFKILIEKDAFPSDRYAVRSQALMRGFDPQEAILEIGPRDGENIIRNEDIIELIVKEGNEIAVICLSGVQYYTGQKFDMESITAVGHQYGCMVGWDLAHAIGNVQLQLEDWDVDFACWCTYKYLNSGPGSIGGAFVNKKYDDNHHLPNHLHGWWSNKPETRFQMKQQCDLAPGVDSFKLSNPSPILVSFVLASLKIIDEAGMERLLAKQRLLTGYLEALLQETFSCRSPGAILRIVTPEDLQQRGCQLSLEFSCSLKTIHKQLEKRGVICDARQPSMMRVTPVPLYNTYSEVFRFVQILKELL